MSWHEARQHPAHARQVMTCERCDYIWIDCPGTWGEFYSWGCPRCAWRYWSARELQ